MVIATWAHILHAVPSSRLVLDNRPFQEPAFRERFLARFAPHGIEPARLDLVFSAPQPRAWAAYGGIDIALDPFPHNAGTTTIEALWQGVPVVSLAGRPTVGRFGASILHAVGLDDWVADTIDGYVERAIGRGVRPPLAGANAARPAQTSGRLAITRRDWPGTCHRGHIPHALGRMARGRRPAPASPLHAGPSQRSYRIWRAACCDATKPLPMPITCSAFWPIMATDRSRPTAIFERQSSARLRRPNCMRTMRQSCARWVGSPMRKAPHAPR